MLAFAATIAIITTHAALDASQAFSSSSPRPCRLFMSFAINSAAELRSPVCSPMILPCAPPDRRDAAQRRMFNRHKRRRARDEAAR